MRIAVYGAAGHTGRFVVAELLRRGHSPIAIARNETSLAAVAAYDGAVERRVAGLDSPDSLDRALAGAGLGDIVVSNGSSSRERQSGPGRT